MHTKCPDFVLLHGDVIRLAMARNTVGHFFYACVHVHFKCDISVCGLVSHSWEVMKYTKILLFHPNKHKNNCIV